MSLARAFVTVSGMTMISRLLGMVREIMVAALLGAGPVAEAFFVAFRLPNLFRRFFAEGAFNMAFVPLFARRLEAEGPDSAREFAEDAYSGLLSALFVLMLAAQLLMPWLILIIAYGFSDDPEKMSLAVLFSRIQFPYLLFMSLAALLSGVLNSIGKFAAAAGAPILLNVLIIVGLSVAWASGGDVGLWLVWSVFASGVAQFALVYVAARRAGMGLRLRRPRWTPGVRQLLRNSAPAAVASGVMQINLLIGTTIATFFDGAVAWMNYADRVYQLPLGVVGVAIGVALLPELSRRLRVGDADGAIRALSNAIELALVLSIPAAVALMVIPRPLVDMLFSRGAFTADDAAQTALALAIFAAGLPAYILNKALSPAYFAEEDTRTPLRFAVIAMLLNTLISAGLAPFVSWISVPIGTAVAAWINVWLLRRGLAGFTPEQGMTKRVAGACAASVVMGGLLWALTLKLGPALADPLLRIPTVLGMVIAGMGVYALFAIGFGAVRPDRLRSMLSRARRRDA